MSNNIISIKIASTIVTTYYKMLMNLASQDKDKTDEFYEIIDKLKKAVDGEEQLYNNLTSEEYDELIKYYQGNKLQSSTDARIYIRVKNYQRLNLPSLIIYDKNILLSSVITAKLIIDVLKMVNQKIDDLEDNDKEIIKLYANIINITYLSSNEFIEKIALNNDFDINEIPVINFSNIEKTFNVKFINEAQDLLMQYVNDSYEELNSLNYEDEYLNEYTKLLELSRIEIMIPYLNKDNLLRVKELCNTGNSDLFTEIKKLIKNKEKDFE